MESESTHKSSRAGEVLTSKMQKLMTARGHQESVIVKTTNDNEWASNKECHLNGLWTAEKNLFPTASACLKPTLLWSITDVIAASNWANINLYVKMSLEYIPFCSIHSTKNKKTLVYQKTYYINKFKRTLDKNFSHWHAGNSKRRT